MKKTLLSTVLLLAAINLGAQNIKFGVNAGTDLLWYSSTQSQFGNSYMKAGAVIGGSVAYALNEHWNINSGFNLIYTKANFSGRSSYYTTVDDKTNVIVYKDVEVKTMSLEMPLTIGYEFGIGRTVKLQPSIGAFGRYGIASFEGDYFDTIERKDQTWKPYKGNTVSPESNRESLGNMRRWDYGVKAGLLLTAGEHYTVSADYMRGFIDQLVKYGMKNNSLRFTLGYTF